MSGSYPGYFNDDEFYEDDHNMKMIRLGRKHKASYVQSEKERELREKHPGLQEAYERYQAILKLVE